MNQKHSSSLVLDEQTGQDIRIATAPATIPTTLPACLKLPFALFEAVGACVLELDAGAEELDAGAEELAAAVEVAVEVSVAVEVEVEMGLELATFVVDGGGAAVSSIGISHK